MTPPQQHQATAGMLATARTPAGTGTPALSKEHKQEKAQLQHNLNSKNASNSRICVEKL
jgi:hypothetical protein